MHSFVEKTDKNKRRASSHTGKSAGSQVALSRDSTTLLQLQRTIGNQAVQRALAAYAAEAETAAAADSTGKLGRPLPDDGPLPEISGRAGAGAVAAAGLAVGAAAEATEAAAGNTTPPKLTKVTQSGPTGKNSGGFEWVVKWELDKVSSQGGWVIQKVELPYDVKDCDGKAVDPKKVGGLTPSWYPLWEAWPINKNQKVTTYAEGGDFEDDTYASGGPGSNTKGTTTVKGTAEFYEGLTLPEDFQVTNKAPTWILPATKSTPTLTGGTGSIPHSLKATWDSCDKSATASKKTKIEIE